MNNTFKVVFNKARNALMAVNELTSSIQKKGTKTIIASCSALVPLMALSADADLAFQGKQGTIDATNQSTAKDHKVIGGWDIYDSHLTVDTAGTTNLTINADYSLDEVIGGNAAKQIKAGSDAENNFSLSSSSTTVDNASKIQSVVGGSKANNASGRFDVNTTELTVNGGSNLGQGGVVTGGSYLKATTDSKAGFGGTSDSHISKTKLTITGGSFGTTVVGGSYAEVYDNAGSQTAAMSVTTDAIENTITGGTYTGTLGAAFIGGSVAKGTGASASVGTATTTIKGGQNFSGVFNGNIHAGSFASDGGTATTGSTVLNLQGNSAEDRLKLQTTVKAIYAGGFNSVVTDRLELNLINVDMNTSSDSKWGIYGGSKFTIAGDYTEGSSFITVENSQINGDVHGGAGVFGNGITLNAGTTSVHVENSQISGYDQGGSTWQGRVFGNGIIQDVQGSHINYAESQVFIGDNVYGVTVDKDTGTITHNPGTAVYGASQLFEAKNSTSTTGKTSVIVTGENTQLKEVYGGGIIGGTLAKDQLSTMVVGQSEVTINSGLVSSTVAGGNISNFFGYSVIGTASENGEIAVNGQRYDEGSTHVTINGGDLSEAFVYGGSYADWGGGNSMTSGSTESTSERVAIVVGKSTVNINGGTVYRAAGGGGAVISMQDGATYAENSNSPDSLVYGQTEVNVTGGQINDVFGGGFALGLGAEVDPDATVHGSTVLKISGGTINRLIGGGYVSGYGTANVTGNVSMYLSGGNIKQIIAGGYAEESKGTAVVEENAVVVFERDFGFDGTVSGEGVEGTSTLQFGTGESAYDGGFSGEFSNFDVLSIASGSTLQLETLTNSNIGDALKINGNGLLKVKTLNHDSGTVTLASGTLDVESIAMTQNGRLVVYGGKLSTTTDQIFTTALQSGNETAAGALLENGVIYASGSLALKDDVYSLEYAESAGKLFDANINVIFLGNLASTDGIGGTTNQATIEELGNVGPNVVLEQVTATTAGTDNDGRNLQIGGTLSHEDVSDTVLRHESLSVAAVDLGTGTKVTITDGKHLNLAGSDNGLITSTATSSDENPAVTVFVQSGASLGLGVGAAAPKGGTLSATVNLESADSKMAVVGDAHYEVEAVTGSGTVTVGNDSASGSLTIHSLNGMTGVIFVDPAWNLSGTNPVSDASHLVISQTGAINAKVVAGQNSLVSFGTDASDAVNAFERIAATKGLAWKDDVTAAAYVGAPIDLTNGGLTIDGSLTTAPTAGDVRTGVYVAAQGMLIANLAVIPTDGALINGEVDFAENSLLGLANVSEGTFKLATSSTGTTTVVTDNPFIEGSLAQDGSGTVSTILNVDTGLRSIASTGLQAMTRRADSVLAGTIADRTSIDQELNAGINLWVDVRGENYQADDFDNGGSFEADMGYGTFGGDMAFGAFTAGAAFQYGTGSLRSSVSSIKNSIDNYAFALYGTYKVTDAFKLAAELAYVWGENDITSSQAALNQSVDTEMYSFGLRAMYELKAGNFSFVPSIGLRVSQLSTDAFQVGSVKVEDQDQTLVQVPIALRINASEFDASGWSVAPSFKIAYVPTFGDKDIEVLGHMQNVIDTSPVQADMGLRIGKGNMMFNVNMLLGAGEYGSSTIGGRVGFKYAF